MPVAFTIRSTELREYSVKHRCTVLKVISAQAGREKILVGLDPSIPGYIYDQPKDLEKVVISPRHKGTTLLPEVSEWPLRVYMCIPEDGGDWNIGPFRILDWGIIEQPLEKQP